MNLFPTKLTEATPVEVRSMADVEAVLRVRGPAYLLQSLRTLSSHTNQQPLSTLPADISWIDKNFPKPRTGRHPRPDLNQKLRAYQKWRADLRRAVELTTGERDAKAELRDRQDAWSHLIAAAKLHSSDGGLIHPGSATLATRLAEIARRAGVTPDELADPNVIDRLAIGFAGKLDRGVLRRAMRFLETWRFLPEIADCLPAGLLAAVPILRQDSALPAHLDAALIRLAEIAATMRDEIAGEDSRSVGDSALAGYLAALRHHVRSLATAPDEPNQGFVSPARELDKVQDVVQLFSVENIKASVRQTERVDGEPGALSQISASSYYKCITVILARNDIDVTDITRVLKSSRYLRDGREMDRGMRPATKAWCEALLTNPDRERRFRNLHRILQAKAQEIVDLAAAENRALTPSELTRARALGVAAAASTIELAGRPIRLSNVLGLRLHGPRANFFTPSGHRKNYSFVLTAEETKAGKEEPATVLRPELHGPQVMSWYLANIRPLFPHATTSIYLFPGVEDGSRPMIRTVFDTWFQRAATAAGLPMSFHRWRHGYASLLLAQDFNNLQIAADMLGNTTAVCARSYAWINTTKLYQQGQDILIQRSKGQR